MACSEGLLGLSFGQRHDPLPWPKRAHLTSTGNGFADPSITRTPGISRASLPALEQADIRLDGTSQSRLARGTAGPVPSKGKIRTRRTVTSEPDLQHGVVCHQERTGSRRRSALAFGLHPRIPELTPCMTRVASG